MFISVVVPTADRPRDLERCLASLACLDFPRWELIVVDQSLDGASEAVVGEMRSRIENCRYVRSAERGAARSRNAAMRLVQGDVIAFLDDDCTVGPGWLRCIEEAFCAHPDVPLIFGRVLGAPGPSSEGLIPAYDFATKRRLRGTLAMLRTGCMSASMYMRPGLWHSVGPIDSCTGAGAVFACEDRDYCYRVLSDGHTVLEVPEITVTHYGGRLYSTGAASRLVRRSAYSIGALHIKALRCGDPAALVLIGVELCRNVARIKPKGLLRRGGPSGLAWMAMYLHGLLAGLRRPVDRRRRLWLAA